MKNSNWILSYNNTNLKKLNYVLKFKNIYNVYDENKLLIYEGELDNNKIFHGFGFRYNVRIKCKKTSIVYLCTIRGIFHNGNISYGKIEVKNNLLYEGTFNNNIPNGIGCLAAKMMINGDKVNCFYKGVITDFTPNGEGDLYYENGNHIVHIRCYDGNINKDSNFNDKLQQVNCANILLNLQKSK